MMNAADIRLRQNPILTNLLLGMGQGPMIAERVFPRLPQTLNAVTLARIGNERFKRYNLRRAPGSATKRLDIKFDGVTYKVDQYSVDVPIPRELVREADESRKLNVGNYLDVSRVAMTTAWDVLGLDYELEAAGVATAPGSYAAGQSTALAGGAKWSASTGTPVTDVRAANEVIRKKTGKRATTLVLAAVAAQAVRTNAEVKGYLPNTNLGPATDDQLKTIFGVDEILIGDAVVKDANDVGTDVWGNNAMLLYVPKIGPNNGDISLAEPAFGFTNVMEGHPFAETPWYESTSKSWIFGCTYERKVSLAYAEAGYLWQNPN